MADQLHLRILTPAREVLSRRVDSVNLPATEGEVGILPGHAAFLTSLRPGPAWFSADGAVQRLALSDGFLEVNDDRVTVLVQTAERAEEIDVPRAEARRAAREAELRRLDLSEVEYAMAEASMQKQLARLQVARHGVGEH